MIPVNIVTGFLGSGKTTLLKEILARPDFSDTAVIVNEFGEVGLDHILLEEVEEGVLLLESGCICCSIRSDLQDTIHSLQKKASAGAIPEFRRLIIETTGIADPAPVVSTISVDRIINKHFYVGNIICTIDAIAGISTLQSSSEASKQVAIADRLLITKSDIADVEDKAVLESLLLDINPTASLQSSGGRNFDARHLFLNEFRDSATRKDEVRALLERDIALTGSHGKEQHHHHHMISSFCVEFSAPVDWVAFGVWLTATLHVHGENILRVKGILNVHESKTPVFIDGVQHIMYPPVHLDQWLTRDRNSRIIFITRGLDEKRIRRSLLFFLDPDSARTSFDTVMDPEPACG